MDYHEKMDRIFPKFLSKRWDDPKGLIQIFIGPRQVGKTTAANRLLDQKTSIYFSADTPSPPTVDLIIEHWKKAREIQDSERTLVLDEIQKIPRWSEVVKSLYDEDKRNNLKLRVALLGSSALLIEKGLSESLTGRFEVNYFPHWTFKEISQLKNCCIENYLLLGGYPKAHEFRDDIERGRKYISNSIVEPILGRDILALHSVDKPALLRQLFWYVSKLPARTVSFNKILGHLQDRGNTATLAHYAELLSHAFIAVPIFKISKASHNTKKSIPKWIIPNPALIDPGVNDGQNREFVFENLIGSHLLNIFYGSSRFKLYYWREGNKEIDYIITKDDVPKLAIEAKSGRENKALAIDVKEFLKDCPFLVVDQKNIVDLLETTNFEEIMSLCNF